MIERSSSSFWRWSLALFEHLLSKFMDIAMFVAIHAFHNLVADPEYGGVYLTLLST